MRRGRHPALAGALALIVGGAVVVLVVASQDWAGAADAAQVGDDTRGPAALRALGFLPLAAGAAMFTVRGWTRRLLAAVVGGAGLGICVAAVVADPRTGPWWALAVAGGAAVAVGGVLAVRHGPAWPALWPYRSPERRDLSRPPRDAWEALDRGEDPTL